MATIHANGITIYHERHGPADAPVLVLNNGILMNAAGSWLPQTPALPPPFPPRPARRILVCDV